MKPISGEVLWLTLVPGRPDTLMLSIADETVGEHHVMFSMASGDVGHGVTIDGRDYYGNITAGVVFEWLLSRTSPLVTVHPDLNRYGLSTRTEFATNPASPA